MDLLDAGVQRDGGQQGSDEQHGAGGDGLRWPEEGRPRHHHEERRRNVHAQQIVAVAALERHLGAKARVFPWEVELSRSFFIKY